VLCSVLSACGITICMRGYRLLTLLITVVLCALHMVAGSFSNIDVHQRMYLTVSILSDKYDCALLEFDRKFFKVVFC